MRGGYYWVKNAGHRMVAEYDVDADAWFMCGKEGEIKVDFILEYIPFPKTK